MPEFSPGEVKTAVAPMTNPTVKAFDYSGFLYMGTDLAIMSQVDFHLEAGEQKDISFPVTMPLSEGTYPVYIGVFSAGENIALYRAIEDVTIVSAVPAVGISGVSWETVDYGYTDDWGNPMTAKFYKAEISVTSDQAFTSRIILSCPNVISPVPLLTEDTYQQLLREIDDLIATTTGATQQLWIDRKAIALQFPSVDGFRIDYRWWANWDQRFRSWIGASIDPLTWQGVNISEGTNIVHVGFFKTQVAGIIAPVIVTLSKDDIPIDSIESTLPGAEAFQILSVDIPTTNPGAAFTIKIGALVPRLTTRQLSTMSIRINLEPAGVYGSIGASKFISSTGTVTFLIDCVAQYEGDLHYDPDLGYYTHWYKLPKGTYPVSARADIWSGYISGDTSYWYEQLAVYDFGVIGQLVVT